MPLHRLLVAVDTAEGEHRSLSLGLALSRQYGSELLICTAIDHAAVMAGASTPDAVYPSASLVLDEVDALANALLAKASARATAAGVRSTTKLLDGRPAHALVTCAKAEGADAIVMATQGKTGLERAFLGSTAEGVLELSRIPTFVSHYTAACEPAAMAETATFARVLVALDDSGAADAAFAFALDLTSAAPDALIACNVVETKDLFAKAAGYGYDPAPMLAEMHAAAEGLLLRTLASARALGHEVRSVVAEGALPDAILEAAAAHEADLIIVGTHGRRGITRFFLGSVADGVVRRSDVPVVVVHTFEAAV